MGPMFFGGIKLHAMLLVILREQMATGKVVLFLSSYALPETDGRQGFRISETDDILGQKYEFPACDHKCPWKFMFFWPGVHD